VRSGDSDFVRFNDVTWHDPLIARATTFLRENSRACSTGVCYGFVSSYSEGAGRPGRIDYYDDPGAPEANSLVPSVNVVVGSDAGEVLMIRRSDNGNWALPGGAIDLGESVAQAGVRETREETGIECEITGLVGIYSDPRHVILYTSNGEARQEFSIVLTGRRLAGCPTSSDESTEVCWIRPSELDGYTMDRSMRIRVNDYLDGKAIPVIR
jgi:8-oxo-dGTP pyrophosphatase MutT (NUDIX family)